MRYAQYCNLPVQYLSKVGRVQDWGLEHPHCLTPPVADDSALGLGIAQFDEEQRVVVCQCRSEVRYNLSY